MSIETRLRHTLNPASGSPYAHLDVEQKLVGVIGTARRQRRVQLASILAAFAVLATLLTLDGARDLFLTFDPPRVEPAEVRRDDDGLITDNDESSPERSDSRVDDGRYDDVRRIVPFGSSGYATEEATRPARDRARRTDGGGSTNSGEPLPPDDGVESVGPSVPGRSETKSYALSAAPAGGGTSSCDRVDSEGAGCVIFDVEDGEHYLSLTARDQAGTDVELSVKFDTDGDGDTEGEWRWVCTSTERALQLPEGTVTVVVEVHRGSCEDGTSSQPTTGTIRAEFS